MSRRSIDLAVLSDIHLGTYGCHAAECLQYLKSIKPKALVLNGDIVDCWQFRKGYFPTEHLDVLRQVARFAAKGVPVYYITGNHDDVFRRFSDLQLGGFALLDQLELELDGKRVLFFHGDAFDVSIRHTRWLAKLGGKSYDVLIRLNRFINRCLLRLGRPRISFSKRIKHSVKRAVRFVHDFEQAAAEWGMARGVDVVVCGHIHQPQDKTIQDRKGRKEVRYLNSGDWVEHLTALEYHQGAWSIWRYEDAMAEAASKRSDRSEPGAFDPVWLAQTEEEETEAEVGENERSRVLASLGQVASAQLLRERALHEDRLEALRRKAAHASSTQRTPDRHDQNPKTEQRIA
jgi:UDP-2,3-diacylglucosamine pyrophosphatase LpxH